MAVDTLEIVKDPVCDMDVEPGKAAALREIEDRTFYFCSKECADRFDEDSERYAKPAAGPRQG